MRKIWKWELDVTDRQSVYLPQGAQILDVQVQNGQVCMWAICLPSLPTQPRYIGIYGTGNPLPDVDLDNARYISTFQMHGGALVFHAFELANDC